MNSAFDVVMLLCSAILAVPALVFTLQCLFGSVLPERHTCQRGAVPAHTVVLVPAHDEEHGIGATVAGLVKAVASELCGQGEVIVIADNCSDNTARIAEDAGAKVLERCDPSRRGKGYAISFAAEALSGSPPDVVVLVDADCYMTPGSLEHLSRLALSTGHPIQADYTISPTADSSVNGGISGFAIVVKNRVRPRCMRWWNLPCQLTGSGMAMPYGVLRDAPSTEGNIVEDMVLGIELALTGRWPIATAQAQTKSELPAQRSAAFGQRKRWEHGHLATLFKYAPMLLWRGVMKLSPRLVAMGLDLAVPPLVLLFLSLLMWGGVCALAATLGMSPWPFWVSLVALGGVLLGAAVAWMVHGREVLPLRRLWVVPFYIIWKVPLYLAFFARRGQREWNRTTRGGAG